MLKKLFLSILVAAGMVYAGRHINHVIHSIGLWVTFFLILKYRYRVADWLCTLRAPVFFVYIVSSLPLMLIEENINCLPSGCKLIPVTIPFLILFLLGVFLIVKKFRLKNFWHVLVMVCSVGLIWELSLGAASIEFRALPILWFIYITLWTWMSYAYFTVIPLTYLMRKSNRDSGILKPL